MKKGKWNKLYGPQTCMKKYAPYIQEQHRLAGGF